MSIPIISENCYTCSNSYVVNKVCKLKNVKITNLYKDRCPDYTQRKLIKCELCGQYLIELAPHVASIHKKTMSEYRILTNSVSSESITSRRKFLWH